MPDFGTSIANVGTISYEMWIEGSTYYARKVSTGEISSNSNFKTLLQAVIDDLAIGAGKFGGTIFIKKGTYNCDGLVNVGNTSYASYWVRLVGEGIDVTNIKRTGSAGHLFAPWCNSEFIDMTLDGNAIAQQLISCGQPVYCRTVNVKITRHTDIGIWYGVDLKGFIADKCIFEDPRGTQDQLAFTCTEYGVVTNCYFDRLNTIFTSAVRGGSCLTSGGGERISIDNNTFVKANTFQQSGFGCSIEPWDRDYNQITITNNHFRDCMIRVGGGVTGDWGGGVNIMRNIVIDGNVLDGAEIGIVGPDTAFSNSIRNVTISNNVIKNPWTAAIRLNYLAGQILCDGNIIIDSNKGLNANTFGDNGLIWVFNCTDTTVSNNKLYMTNVTALASPYGIGYTTSDRLTIKGNSIYNVTSNPDYSGSGTNTNLIIIKDSDIVSKGSITYDYVISKVGSTYYATKWGETSPKYSGTGLTSVVNNASSDLGATGGVVAFASNTEFIASGASIELRDKVKFVGMDRTTSIVKNSSAHNLFYWNPGSGLQLMNGGIKNLHLIIHDPTTTAAAVYLDGSQYFEFIDNWVESKSTPSGATIAVFLDTDNDTHFNLAPYIVGNKWTGSTNGQDNLGMGGIDYGIFDNNQFLNIDGQAIGVANTNRSLYTNNVMKLGSNMIGFEGVCEGNTIANNNGYGTGGIKLSQEGTTTNISRRNHCHGNHIEYGSGGIEDGVGIEDTIENNVISRTSRNGIRGAFNACKISNNYMIDTNYDNNSQTINGSARTVGGIICINNATPLPDCDNNMIDSNTMRDSGVAFTEPISGLSKNGNTGGIVIDTSYDDTRLQWNTYASLVSSDVLDFGTNTVRVDVDDDRHINLFSGQHIKVKGNDGLPITFLNFNGNASPSQTLHFFPDYTKQVGATAVELLFGYNSDLTNVNFYSKWSGSNKEFFKLDAVAGDIKLNALTRVGDVDINYLLRLYRTTNTVNNETSLAFDLRNASNTQTEYASIAAEIITNTAGDEDGQIRFKTRKDGATNTKMILNKDGFLSVGGNLRLGFDDTGLTAFRAFTFPDLSGQLAVSGVMLKTGYLSVTTSPVTLSATTDQLVKVDASGGVRTVNLPAASGNSGLFYTILKSDSSANAVTIDGNASETINGSTTFLLTAQYQSVTLRCDGANWFTQPNSTERTGKALASGNGSTTLFNIAHGLGATPSNAMISVSKPSIARTYTVDSTNIAVTFDSAPANASNNVEIYWRVVA
jgi:hypothetical protein